MTICGQTVERCQNATFIVFTVQIVIVNAIPHVFKLHSTISVRWRCRSTVNVNKIHSYNKAILWRVGIVFLYTILPYTYVYKRRQRPHIVAYIICSLSIYKCVYSRQHSVVTCMIVCNYKQVSVVNFMHSMNYYIVNAPTRRAGRTFLPLSSYMCDYIYGSYRNNNTIIRIDTIIYLFILQHHHFFETFTKIF